MTNPKIEALAAHLDIILEEGETLEDYIDEESDTEFHAEGNDYLVLTDDEADAAVVEYVKDSAWAFNSSFLAEFTELPEEVFTSMQGNCEDSNSAVLSLIEKCGEGIEAFAAEASSADGRGHFLNWWNGAEDVEGDFYIYRR